MMTVGQFAKVTGVGVETIRYYEKNGILPTPDRLPSGYRVYDEESVRQVHFIQKAQALGFRLSEIVELMALANDPKADCTTVNARMKEKIIEIDDQLERLTVARENLGRLITYCPTDDQPLSACPVIHHLYGEETEG